jgi:hypothetical protein
MLSVRGAPLRSCSGPSWDSGPQTDHGRCMAVPFAVLCKRGPRTPGRPLPSHSRRQPRRVLARVQSSPTMVFKNVTHSQVGERSIAEASSSPRTCRSYLSHTSGARPVTALATGACRRIAREQSDRERPVGAVDPGRATRSRSRQEHRPNCLRSPRSVAGPRESLPSHAQ